MGQQIFLSKARASGWRKDVGMSDSSQNSSAQPSSAPEPDAAPANLRSVTLRRTGFSTFEATNVRGGTLTFGEGDGTTFSPVELLLAAVAGCSATDVDYVTSRRAEPVSFEVVSTGIKSSEGTNHLEDLRVEFRIRFPDGPDGDAARARLPQAVRRSHDQLCTVARTVIEPTSVTMTVE